MKGTLHAILNHARTHERGWRRLVIAVGIVVLLALWIRLGIEQQGDFKLHWELGRRLAAGVFIYEAEPKGNPRGLDYPYPPFWALAHVPLTVFPRHAAQLVFYPVVFAALVGLLWVLNRLCERTLRLNQTAAFWVSVLAVALSSRFLVRDALECGVNLALVTLSWLGVYLWTRRREGWGGLALGLAMALKCTPTLFLVYFAWKRQWKMAAYTFAAAVLFTVSPVLWMGPTNFVRTFGHWTTNTWDGFSQADPSIGVLGPEPLQNLSLRPALARFLMHLPSGHKGRFDHALSTDFLNFSPSVAGVMIRFVFALLLIGVAWACRAPVNDRNNPSIVWECAAVSLLILLFSPITWGQHCVGVLPALYLVCRAYCAHRRLPRGVMGVMAAYGVLILLLNRGVIGKDLTYLLNNYHITTWCVLGLLAAVIACRLPIGKESAAAATLSLPSLDAGVSTVTGAALQREHTGVTLEPASQETN